MITIIAAMDENRLIGNGNDIPWYIPEDFRHFKQTTAGHPIIMGRNTWDSLPKKPLPNRTNIVISRSPPQETGGAVWCTSLDEAVLKATQVNENVFIIGGQNIYEQSMNIADALCISKVIGAYEGDKYFPEIGQKWSISDMKEHDGFVVMWYRRESH